MSIKVVLIAETTTNFISVLQKHYETYLVRSGKQGAKSAIDVQADVIILDAISLGTTGDRICKRLREAFPDRYLIHLYPKKKAKADSVADALLCAPISPRTLLSTIALLVTNYEQSLLRCGDFALDLDRRILIVGDDETALTPKQSALIETFLRHPNQTLERKWLMQRIWNTDYTGDTRTLNVHIRFVREVLEKDASNPQFIKTVRGVGYRFEVPLK